MNYIESYIKYLQRKGYNKITIKDHGRYIKHFNDFLISIGMNDLLTVTITEITQYQEYRLKRRNRFGKTDSPEFLNHVYSAIKGFYEYLKREGIIYKNNAEEIEYHKVPKRLPQGALTLAEFNKIIGVIDTQTILGYRDRTILEMLYSTGIRRKELIGLNLNDVDYEGGYAKVTGKGNKERVVPIGKTASQYLETYIKCIRPGLKPENVAYVFLTKHGQRLTRTALKRMIKKYAWNSGLEKHVTPHTFRRSAATGMIRNKANVVLVSEMLGHENVSSIQPYINLTINDLKEVHKKTHPRERK
ncbi:MAG: hypothetical protein ACD_79C01364G0003 [uncultured bacterium]|nr:MAG: hypothetical protein ACD_79C01364G0003 [uncultured bacterium]